MPNWGHPVELPAPSYQTSISDAGGSVSPRTSLSQPSATNSTATPAPIQRISDLAPYPPSCVPNSTCTPDTHFGGNALPSLVDLLAPTRLAQNQTQRISAWGDAKKPFGQDASGCHSYAPGYDTLIDRPAKPAAAPKQIPRLSYQSIGRDGVDAIPRGHAHQAKESMAEEGRHYLALTRVISTVHDICLDATKSYMANHRVNFDVRNPVAGNPFRKGSAVNARDSRRARSRYSRPAHTRRYEAYPAPHRSMTSRGGSRRLSTFGTPQPTESLLTNVSGICDMIWTRGRRDRLHVPESERMAVSNMACLLEWAETVVLGDRDEWRLDEEDVLMRVGLAGRNICDWLGDEEGSDVIETMVSEF